MNLDTMEARLIRNSVLDPATGCWLWIGKRSADGYGKLTVRQPGKASPVNVYAHRMAVVAFQGKTLRSDLHVDHICRNPSCINPEHLRLVKAETNLGRRRHNRITATYCTRCGFSHGVSTACTA